VIALPCLALPCLALPCLITLTECPVAPFLLCPLYRGTSVLRTTGRYCSKTHRGDTAQGIRRRGRPARTRGTSAHTHTRPAHQTPRPRPAVINQDPASQAAPRAEHSGRGTRAHRHRHRTEAAHEPRHRRSTSATAAHAAPARARPHRCAKGSTELKHSAHGSPPSTMQVLEPPGALGAATHP
jgi:hypothetical protein